MIFHAMAASIINLIVINSSVIKFPEPAETDPCVKKVKKWFYA